MKIKFLLMSALAIATLASCNKEGVSPTGDTSSLQFKISVPETKAIQDPGTATAPALSSMKVELMNASDVVLETYTLTSAQISADQSATGYVFEQVTDAATKVKVTANGLATPSTAIAAYQTTFAAVPFSGSSAITYSSGDVNTDGHKLKKAAVPIVSEVARVEVVGGINVDKAVNGYYAVDVLEVYINNYLATSTATTPYFVNHNTPGDGLWQTPNNFGTDKTWNSITTTAPATGAFYATNHNVGILTGKSDAYHIFPAAASASDKATVESELMHIVLKVNIYKEAADYPASPVAEEHWITIRSFNDGSSLIDKFEAGKIYKLDLSTLTDKFKPGEEPPTDPDPESAKADLELKVTVTPWSIVTMTPNI